MTEPPSHPSSSKQDPSPAAHTEPGSQKRTRPRLGVVAGILVTIALLAAVGTGVFLLLSNRHDPESDARETAQRFAELYQRALKSGAAGVSPTEFEPIVCGADMNSVRQDITETPMEEPTEPLEIRISVREVRLDGTAGTVTLNAEISLSNGQRHSIDETLDLVTEHDGWRVCGLHRMRASG
jgi:hypothetical protein